VTYELDEIRQKAIPIAKRYGVRRLGLFGSYARGKQTEEMDKLFQCPLNRVQRRLCSEATYTHQIRSQHRMKSSWAAKDLPSP
jgi:hypothetical protein